MTTATSNGKPTIEELMRDSELAGIEWEIVGDRLIPSGKSDKSTASLVKQVRQREVEAIRYLEPRPEESELDALDDSKPLGAVLKCMADVEPCEVSWLWPGRFPLGRISILVGMPGAGKSFVVCDAAARVSRGHRWPDGSECPQGDVLLMSAEDDPADTIRPRLDAHHADVRHVHLLEGVKNRDSDGEYERGITLQDVGAIEDALKRLPNCKLLVIDPIGSFLGGGTDAHRDNEVRALLTPLAKLAEQYGPAVVLIMHRRKSHSGHADDLALGSRAFTGVARAVWHLAKDVTDRTRRLLLPGKCNLSRESLGLAFSIQGAPASLVWEENGLELSADEQVLNEAESGARKRGPDSSEQQEALRWLFDVLADGPRLAKELKDEWANEQSGSPRTLERAKKAGGVAAFRQEVPGPWWWRLPGDEAKNANTGQFGDLGGLVEKQVPSEEKLGDLGPAGEQLGGLGPSEEKLGDLGGLAKTPEKMNINECF